jgi:hypothetical protein
MKELYEHLQVVINISRIAAPYVHPRLANVDYTEDQGVQRVMKLPDQSPDVETWLRNHKPRTIEGGEGQLTGAPKAEGKVNW